MKHIPNILSETRIALCLPLLLVDAMTVPFWVLYVIAGTTDMLDGFVPIIPYRHLLAKLLYGIDDVLYSHLLAHSFFEGDAFWIDTFNMGKTCIQKFLFVTDSTSNKTYRHIA